MKKSLLGVMAVALSLISLQSQASIATNGCTDTTSCTLSELFAGGSIQINDVLFDNWVFGFEDGGLLDRTAVAVSGVDEVVDSADPTKSSLGLTFQADPAISFDFLEFDFSFSVTINGSSRMLIGNSLELSDFSIVGDAFVEVNADLSTGDLLSVDDGTLVSSIVHTPGLSGLNIDADIQMEAFDDQSSASLSRFGMLFTVMGDTPVINMPLPTPLVLMLLGGLGMGLCRKFR